MTLPDISEPLPSSVTFGKVIGRVVHLIADTAEDTDDKPQARSAAGKVTFTPKDVLRKTTDADYPAIVLSTAETANLSSSGRVLDAEGRQGIWLAVGVYAVNFEITGAPRAIPTFDINVTTAHTDATPLDLAKEAPYVAPSGTMVQTLVVPAGGTTGQVLIRTATGGLEWADQTATSAVDSVNGQTGVVVLDAADLGAATTQALTDGLAAKVNTSTYTAGLAAKANTADLAAVATTGTYADLTGKPAIPDSPDDIGAQPAGDYATTASVTAASTADRARANHTGTQPVSTVTGLATVATSGSYADLTAKPIIPAAYTDEQARDAVATALRAGANVTIATDDAADTITISATGTNTTDPEVVRDTIATALVAGANVTITPNDTGDTITIASTAVLPTRQVIAGTGLTGGGDLSADRTLAVTYGTGAGTAAQGNDSRLTAGTAGVATVRALGTGSTQAAAGNDSRITGAVQRAATKRVVPGAYTLVAGDATADIVLHSTASTAVTITLPADTVSIAQDVAIPWRQYGAGQITFAAGSGATLVSRGSVFKSAGAYAEGVVTKVAANTWLLSGDIAA